MLITVYVSSHPHQEN